MVLYLFEYSEETDNEVDTVHDQANHDETNQCELAVTEGISDLSHVG